MPTRSDQCPAPLLADPNRLRSVMSAHGSARTRQLTHSDVADGRRLSPDRPDRLGAPNRRRVGIQRRRWARIVAMSAAFVLAASFAAAQTKLNRTAGGIAEPHNVLWVGN